MTLKKPPKEGVELALKVLANATVLPDPPEEAVQSRLAELEALGLKDNPEFEGISSSVRQYAISSILAEQGLIADDNVFVTLDAGLLAKADELAGRFGLKPTSLFKIPGIAEHVQ